MGRCIEQYLLSEKLERVKKGKNFEKESELSKRHVKPQPTQSSAGYKCQDAQASFFLYFPLFSYFLLCPSVRWAYLRRQGDQQVDMVPVCFRCHQFPLEPLAEVSGMFFHKVPDLLGDHRPPVLCDKHDVVSQKIYGVGTFPVFHKASFKCYTSCIFNVFMV